MAEMSILVREMLADDDDDESPEIPLPNVTKAALARIVEFCTRHVDNPMTEITKPLRSRNMVTLVGAWDAAFVDQMDQSELFSVIIAANYLDIPPLLDLGCAKVATMIKGKTAEEVRRSFNIAHDFCLEEVAQIRAEHERMSAKVD